MPEEIREFVEFWDKFYEIHKNLISSSSIAEDVVTEFKNTKRLLEAKFRTLKNLPQIDSYSKRKDLLDSITNILRYEDLNVLSDSAKEQLKENWDYSRYHLNELLNIFSSKPRQKGPKGDRLIHLLTWVSKKTYGVIMIITALVCFLYFLSLCFLRR